MGGDWHDGESCFCLMVGNEDVQRQEKVRPLGTWAMMEMDMHTVRLKEQEAGCDAYLGTGEFMDEAYASNPTSRREARHHSFIPALAICSRSSMLRFVS